MEPQRYNIADRDMRFTMDEYVERIASDLARTAAADLPDFFVLSPPRTGTTWLANVLSSHPGVYIPPEKELRYFDVGWRFSTISFYLQRYAHAAGRLKGDASPTYVLLPDRVIRLLHQAKPAMKFIVILRDMGSRAWSNFRHSYAIGEFGLHSEPAPWGVMAEEVACRYLISDYSIAVGDYSEYLGRWLRYFPVGQFFIMNLDDIEHDPTGALKRLYEFLDITYEPVDEKRVGDKVNVGMWLSHGELVKGVLTALYRARHLRQRIFLRDTFGAEVQKVFPLPERAAPPQVLVNRADGYTIFVWNGLFHACFVEEFRSVSASLQNGTTVEGDYLVADFYSDLERQIGARKTGVVSSLTFQEREDARLMIVLHTLMTDYRFSNQVRVNLRHHKVVREHKGFNLIAFEGMVVGLRKDLGPIDLTSSDPKSLVEKYGSHNVIVARSFEEGIDAIDGIESSEARRVETRFEQQLGVLTKRLREIAPESDMEPHIIEEYHGYNLIAHEDRVWAVAQAAGPLDFTDKDMVKVWEDDGRLVRAVTLDGARIAVDRIRDRCAIEDELQDVVRSTTARLAEQAGRVAEQVAGIGTRVRTVEATQEEVARRLVAQVEAMRHDVEARLAELAALLATFQQKWTVRLGHALHWIREKIGR
jgi:hypothetical protein